MFMVYAEMKSFHFSLDIGTLYWNVKSLQGPILNILKQILISCRVNF